MTFIGIRDAQHSPTALRSIKALALTQRKAAMYFILSLVGTIAAAVFSGIQFARTGVILKNGKDDKRDFALPFASGLLAFAFPFFSPISDNLGASVSFFIAVSALSTWAASRVVK